MITLAQNGPTSIDPTSGVAVIILAIILLCLMGSGGGKK